MIVWQNKRKELLYMPKVRIIDWTKVAENELQALYSGNGGSSPPAS
jgi:hypothetical protein